MPEVTALGELLIDFTCTGADENGYPAMQAHPGGAPANFLAALARFGTSCAMIGKVGADAFGCRLTDTLAAAGIDTRGIAADENTFTTLAFVTLDDTGNREFSFARKPGADTRLSFEEIDLQLICDAKVFHFGSLSLTDEPSRTATKKAVSFARSKGRLISYDPNLRLPLWKDAACARQQILWGLSQADIVKISKEETEFLFGCSVQESAARILHEYGAKLVFVTCGADGCFFKNGLCEGHVFAPKGVRIADTTGAGDIFGGSAIHKILQLGKAPQDLTKPELYEIASFACAAATLSASKPGGISSVPEKQNVYALLCACEA